MRLVAINCDILDLCEFAISFVLMSIAVQKRRYVAICDVSITVVSSQEKKSLMDLTVLLVSTK